MKRTVGIVLAVLLAIGVVAAVVVGSGMVGLGGSVASRNVVVVRGVIGSEKKPFFDDPEVQQILRDKGYDVQVETAGSRQIATLDNLTDYDFAFPSSAPAAERIKRANKTSGAFTPFSSPMAVATYTPIEKALAPTGILKRENGVLIFDVDKYLQGVDDGLRWDKIPKNTTYPASKSVLVTTSDVRKSNSAAMFLSIASYVANGNNVVSSKPQATKVLPQMTRIFLDQGYSESSTEAPFEDYLSLGKGKTPMVLAYEAQFLDRQMRADGSITDEMVLAYPKPEVLSKHTVLAFKDPGREVGRLLSEDPQLQRLAAVHGFRPQSRQVFTDVLKERKVASPPELVDVIEPPAYEMLETMIVGIEKQY